jgi:3-methyladenine DNA glycosylase/8-oxoguanine DNA glycosylase
LARSIIGQQISVKAAQAVWDRFENKIKKLLHKYAKYAFYENEIMWII